MRKRRIKSRPVQKGSPRAHLGAAIVKIDFVVWLHRFDFRKQEHGFSADSIEELRGAMEALRGVDRSLPYVTWKPKKASK